MSFSFENELPSDFFNKKSKLFGVSFEGKTMPF
jgi:hypothetical protein